MSPSPTSVEAGLTASLRCSSPEAVPPPRVAWLKHGTPLQQDHNVVISAEGNLVISRATLQVCLCILLMYNRGNPRCLNLEKNALFIGITNSASLQIAN